MFGSSDLNPFCGPRRDIDLELSSFIFCLNLPLTDCWGGGRGGHVLVGPLASAWPAYW